MTSGKARTTVYNHDTNEAKKQKQKMMCNKIKYSQEK